MTENNICVLANKHVDNNSLMDSFVLLRKRMFIWILNKKKWTTFRIKLFTCFMCEIWYRQVNINIIICVLI